MRTRRSAFRTILSVVALAMGLSSGCATTAQRGALARAYDAFNARAYRNALSHAGRALSYEASSAASRAEAVFLQARCHEALGEREAAVAAYQTVARDYGTTAFATQARARLAELKP